MNTVAETCIQSLAAYFLFMHPLGAYDHKRFVLNTEYLRDQQAQSMDQLAEWWEQLLFSGQDFWDNDFDGIEVTRRQVFESYKVSKRSDFLQCTDL